VRALTSSSVKQVCATGPGSAKHRGLDQNAVELVLALHQAFDDAGEVAAQVQQIAAVVHLANFIVGIDHEVVVDAELAEFVHDDSVFCPCCALRMRLSRVVCGAEIAGAARLRALRLGHGISSKIGP